MNLTEFAKTIDGKENDYPLFTDEEIQIAKDNGFVIVYGASDDLMEFEGAISDEGGCYDGGEVFFDRNGVAYDEADKKSNVIEALWCNDNERDASGNIITWAYKTDIPHETFMIYEDNEPYCRGIVFSINDIA